VIVERAPSGLQLSRLDSTAFRIAPDQAAAHPGGFEGLTGSRSLVDVTLGDTDYKLYVQPMQLSLQGEPVGEQSASGAPEPKSAASHTAATTDASSKTAAAKTSANKTSGARETKRQAEEWALCGLLRAD